MPLLITLRNGVKYETYGSTNIVVFDNSDGPTLSFLVSGAKAENVVNVLASRVKIIEAVRRNP
jgi:hypothetical protein